LAHEIRNQLAGITLPLDNIDFSLDRLGITDPQIQNNLNQAQTNLQQIENLFEAILYPQKITLSGKENVNIKELFTATLADLQESFNKNQIKIIKNIPENLTLDCFKGKLKQVIINLIINASQAFKETQATKTIIINITNKNNSVNIEIKDNGRGIAKEKLQQIFDYGFTTKPKGSGIGLNVSQEIIAEHQGKITVTSQEKIGTTFTISLPN